jgi:hypothetical protein
MVNWAMQPFLWLIEDQHMLITKTVVELKRKGMIDEICHLGKNIRIVTITSDDANMVQIAKTSMGMKANLVICKNSRGNICISPSNWPFIDLAAVFKALTEEEKFWGGDPTVWFIQKEEQLHRIFNGSLSFPNVLPTKIPLGRVYGIIASQLKSDRKIDESKNSAIVRNIA